MEITIWLSALDSGTFSCKNGDYAGTAKSYMFTADPVLGWKTYTVISFYQGGIHRMGAI